MKNEVWKDIDGYNGDYQVSDMGRVKSLKRGGEIIMKASVKSIGYYRIYLLTRGQRKEYMIHQLVAMAFLNHTPCGHKIVVDHINHDRLDNRAINLQLVSNRENSTKDRFRGSYSSKHIGVSWSKLHKKWRSDINIDGKQRFLGCFTYESEAANAYQNALKDLKLKNKAVI
jgi:hypothetical protein